MNKVFIAIVLCIATLATVFSLSPIEEFVQRPDEGISYYVANQWEGTGYTAYVLNLTSLNWLDAQRTNHPRWWHWVTICVPHVVEFNTGFLMVDNGNYGSPVPTTLHPLTDALCHSSRSVVSYLHNVPNQAIQFNGDGVDRSEDAILAYGWRRFMVNHTDTDWIGQFPETKAVVRTMDAITDFAKKQLSFVRVKNFVVTGLSKRGWASWLTAAVDSRVKAVIPIVMPIGNLVDNCINHYRSYGGWSYAYYNYFSEGVMSYLNKPEFPALAKLIDPIYFVDKLMIPKYICTAVGDQFFLPFSTNLFFSQLLGQKHIRIQPNTDHSMQPRFANLIAEINTYYNMFLNKERLPQISWSIKDDPSTNSTTIIVDTKTGCGRDEPTSVVVWTADTISTTKMDFRAVKCVPGSIPGYDCESHIQWVASPVTALSDGLYKVTINAPLAGGWRGAFVELTYDSNYGEQKYTTDFAYAPYRLPFDNCGDNCMVGFPAL